MILLSNVLPNITSAFYIPIFVNDLPPYVLKLLENTLISLNFGGEVIWVDFSYFGELLPWPFKKFKVLIYEEKTILKVFKKMVSPMSRIYSFLKISEIF
jgi:hypothetical protein